METLQTVSVLVGIAGFAFGVWTYFAARKTAILRYQISQFADYRMPPEFLAGLATAPVKLRTTSLGNKSARNVAIRIKMKFPVVAFEMDPSEIVPNISGNELHFEISQLNPQQEVKWFLTCNGDPKVDQVGMVQVTHDEGVAHPSA